jgi:hypothetical protein
MRKNPSTAMKGERTIQDWWENLCLQRGLDEDNEELKFIFFIGAYLTAGEFITAQKTDDGNLVLRLDDELEEWREKVGLGYMS